MDEFPVLIRNITLSKNKARQLEASGRRIQAVAEMHAAIAAFDEGAWTAFCKDPEVALTTKQQVAADLSDAFGILGGLERRGGRLREAVAIYRRGREIETTPGLDLNLSYNLVNALTAPLEAGDVPDAAQHAAEVAAAIDVLERQMRGPRREDCWARADLALCYALASEQQRSLATLRQLSASCPAEIVESARTVWESLGNALAQRADPRAALVAAGIEILGRG